MNNLAKYIQDDLMPNEVYAYMDLGYIFAECGVESLSLVVERLLNDSKLAGDVSINRDDHVYTVYRRIG
jgi:hypothetical protein